MSILVIYVVKSGDSIYSIAQEYNMSPNKIIKDNELTNPNELVVGQTLVLLNDMSSYRVKPGDTIYGIAAKNDVSPAQIIKANPGLINPERLYVGQVIMIPGSSTEKYGSMDVNGYAFPNISDEVLEKTLPYLTYISIFSHKVKADGTFDSIPDERVIKAAREAGVAPLMVLTNIKPGGGFDSQVASTILNDEDIQDTLIKNVEKTLEEKNYYGVDIDFEYILPEDREAYNAFLKKITEELRPKGYSVTTALAPKESADKVGVLYQGHDYKVHGELANHVIIMTYEWGYTYGPPLAVSPINKVREVLDYAVTEIPSEKILTGIPNYGYDWKLPYEEGTAAKTVTNTGAVSLAASTDSKILYDEESAAPYFNYYDSDGVEHVVWFNDARTIEEFMNVVRDKKLGGVSYWTINKYFPQNWLVVKSLYDINKVL